MNDGAGPDGAAKPPDYVIVGAGSAGAALASRLTEDPDCRVLLLEAGGADGGLHVRMPAALAYPMRNPRFNWMYRSEAEPNLDGRSIDCARGKGFGGSSSINGMVYVRGHACDYEEWAERGAAGWEYRNCLPYFRRAETWAGGADDWRGGAGPLGVCAGNGMRLNPLYEAFIRAGVEAGYGENVDYNGERQEGFGPYHMTVKGGVRCSTAVAYLRPAMWRPNLEVVRHAIAHRVVLERGRAAGVEYSVRGKRTVRRAEREVILSAGSIGSPCLLQRSGIGPAEVLERAGVEVAHDLPGVGENLQDHLEVYLQHKCRQPITLNGKFNPLGMGLIGAEWLLFKTGLGATNHFEAGCFFRSRAGLKSPDVQCHFLPGAIRYDGTKAYDGHGYQVHLGLNKPRSRGHVRIRDASPESHPEIRFNYLEEEQDRRDWIAAIRLIREVMAQPALKPYDGGELQPGPSVSTDEEILAWVRANAETAYHPSCSCPMGGDDDPLAVLDPECRVRGVDALRVVDSSSFPTAPNGNLNAPTIMVGERCADLIAGKEMLVSDAGYWIDPLWETRQREHPPQRAEIRKTGAMDETAPDASSAPHSEPDIRATAAAETDTEDTASAEPDTGAATAAEQKPDASDADTKISQQDVISSDDIMGNTQTSKPRRSSTYDAHEIKPKRL